MELESNERIDDLQFKDLKIIQNKQGFCFGIDAILLSDFAKGMKKANLVVDLCTGTGIVAILLAGKTEAKKIIGVEIQKPCADMARRSVELNKLENRVEILNEDLILDDGKFYELFKVKYNENAKKINVKDEISYEISSILLESNNSLVNDYIKSKIKKYENIITYIKDDTSLAKKKKDILNEKINKLKEMIS